MSEAQDTEFALQPKKTAVIVGASSGIGAALAKRMAREGYRVALLARREEELAALTEKINRAVGPGYACYYVHDVTDFDAIPVIFQKVLGDLGRIDVLIYNTGMANAVNFSEYDFAKERPMIAVNLLGAMAWLGLGATLFEQMGSGHLVGISSVAGDRGRVGNPAYNTAKAGLSTYLEALRNRLTRSGVRVLTVKPGFVDTAMGPGPGSRLAISPTKAAIDIYRAIKRRRQVIYTPGWWRYLMLAIRHTPSFIFRRLSF